MIELEKLIEVLELWPIPEMCNRKICLEIDYDYVIDYFVDKIKIKSKNLELFFSKILKELGLNQNQTIFILFSME